MQVILRLLYLLAHFIVLHTVQEATLLAAVTSAFAMLCASAMLGIAVTAQSTWVDTLLAASAVPPSPPEGPHQPPADQFEMSDLIQPLLSALNHLNLEELVMLITAIWPLGMGLLAMMHAISSNSPEDEVAWRVKRGLPTNTSLLDEENAIAQLSSRTEAALQQSSSDVQSTIGGVEQKVADLQRNHDTRFADLHKDLAGIVWELSKLRADMARWQVTMALIPA